MNPLRSRLAALRPHVLPSAEARIALAHLEGEIERAVEDLEASAGRVDRMLALFARVGALDWSAPLDSLGAAVLQTLAGVLEADRGVLALLRPDGSYQVLASHGPDGTPPDWSAGVVEKAFAARSPYLTSDARGERALAGHASVAALGLRSVCCVPVIAEGLPIGFLWLEHRGRVGLFDEDAVNLVTLWLPVLASAMDRALRAVAFDSPLPGFLTRNARLLAELRDLARVARFDVPILLSGETGTGKSMLARTLHRISPRAGGPFVHVNCGAIPEGLLDAELFGAERGAYTGAQARRIGHIEAANRGTLFLDELDAMPLVSQVKLLVALQERTVVRLGSSTPVPVDVRVLSATGRPPESLVRDGLLRADLYYRLGVVVAEIPPLRERPEDLPGLLGEILERLRAKHGIADLRLAPSAADEVSRWPWPGNVRELENTLERAALLAEEGVIRTLRLPTNPPALVERVGARKGGAVPRAEFEKAMAEAGGDPGEAARLLGVHRRSVLRLAARFANPDP